MGKAVKKTVGIMGGMGPMATADLFYNIISATDAKCDSDHVHLLIDNDTDVPDRTQAILYGAESPLPHLCTMAKKLEYMGADVIAISCNTSHYYFSQICEAVNVPVINMIDETARYVAKKGYKKALLLATDATAKMGLYSDRLGNYLVDTVYPSEALQKEVMRLIYDCVKAGNYELDITELLSLLEREADCPVILGCTELPMAFRHFGIDGYDVVDPSKILARAIVLAAGANLKE